MSKENCKSNKNISPCDIKPGEINVNVMIEYNQLSNVIRAIQQLKGVNSIDFKILNYENKKDTTD